MHHSEDACTEEFDKLLAQNRCITVKMHVLKDLTTCLHSKDASHPLFWRIFFRANRIRLENAQILTTCCKTSKIAIEVCTESEHI